jgi:hypothetical protein
MKNLVKPDASGHIWQGAFTQESEGEGWIEIDQDAISVASGRNLYRYFEGQLTETDKPRFAPNSFDVWDENLGEWVDSRDLEQKKLDKWTEIKAARTAQEFDSFEWGGYVFQCDEVSQRRIQGAVQLAAIDTNTVMDWTLADNTVQTFNATELQQIGQALGAHVNACHVKARDLRDQINAAQTEAELSIITW